MKASSLWKRNLSPNLTRTLLLFRYISQSRTKAKKYRQKKLNHNKMFLLKTYNAPFSKSSTSQIDIKMIFVFLYDLFIV